MILIRSLLFNAWLIAVTTAICVMGVGTRLFAPQRTFSVGMLWARLLLRGLSGLCGITWRVTGLEHLPPDGGAALIASQHQSAFDTIIWATLVPRVSNVYKSELGRIPLFGDMLRDCRQIGVVRGGGPASMRDLLRQAEQAFAERRQIVIFPEGTRVAYGERKRLRPGIAAVSAHTGVAVLPVATDSGRHWGRRAFLKRPGMIEVVIGAPLPATLPPAEMLNAIERFWRKALPAPGNKGDERGDQCG